MQISAGELSYKLISAERLYCINSPICMYINNNLIPLKDSNYQSKKEQLEGIAILSYRIKNSIINYNESDFYYNKESNVYIGKLHLNNESNISIKLKMINEKYHDIVIPNGSEIYYNFHYSVISPESNNCYLTVSKIKYGNNEIVLNDLFNNIEKENNFTLFTELDPKTRNYYNGLFLSRYLNTKNCEKIKEMQK